MSCLLRKSIDTHADSDRFVEAPGSSKLYRLHHYKNHPVKWAKVIGVVVAVDEYTGRRIYTIDDSSGACIECSCVLPTALSSDLKTSSVVTNNGNTTTSTKSKSNERDMNATAKEQGVNNPNVPYGIIDVGSVVKIKGRIGSFRDVMQIEVVNAVVVKETEVEVKFWNEALRFKGEVLDKEWELNGEQVEEMRKKDERRRKKEYRKRREKSGNGSDVIRNENFRERRVKSEDAHKESVQHLKKRGHEELKDEGVGARALLRQELNRRPEEVHGEKQHSERHVGKQGEVPIDDNRRRFKDFVSARQLSRYPSLAVRKAAAGKYDLLGI